MLVAHDRDTASNGQLGHDPLGEERSVREENMVGSHCVKGLIPRLLYR